jgi:hypothetical protein
LALGARSENHSLRSASRMRSPPLVRLEQIFVRPPLLFLDNLNTHKPEHDRWLARHKNVHFHFTPTHASWLNLVEV